MQSAKIDALGDNLAADWIKKKRPNGSTYYLNLMTGVKQAVPPRGLTSTGANAPPPRGNLPHCESQVIGSMESLTWDISCARCLRTAAL